MVVYIEEAHASDGWKFKNNYDINVHRSLEDRFSAANKLKELKPGCPIVVDKMSNDANKAYGGLYERLYILLDGVTVYEGGRGPALYKLEEIKEWLHNYVNA